MNNVMRDLRHDVLWYFTVPCSHDVFEKAHTGQRQCQCVDLYSAS